MLGILFLYFIGKSFYRLAEIYNKSKWTFTVLGIAVYFVGNFGVQLFIIYVLGYYENPLGIALVGIPFGLLAWWGLYYYLKKEWSKKGKPTNQDVLDEGLFDN
jgi:hypothetical protein